MFPLQVVLLIILHIQLAVSNYDEHMTCGRSYRQMRLDRQFPCDLAVQNWCGIPGESYPWSEIRRFLLENQGLMRRMYGAIRQRTLLRAELETNNINVGTARHNNNIFSFSEKIPVDTKVNINTKFAPTEAPISVKTEEPPITPPATTFTNTSSDHSGGLRNTSTEVPPHTTALPQSTTTPKSSFDITTPFQNELDGSDPTTDNGLWTAEEVFTTLAMSEPTLVTGFGVSESTTFDQDEGSYEDVTSRIQDRIDLDAFLEGEALPSSDPLPAPPISVGDAVGVNACPVKEEVVAPYWANNTRGEVLALLNLYPFEQYVHWEKCTYEHKQMFCRDGCRCEQQYRLHRMLAFDPNNECRGIFSDWFKFPSCCVCKCYNLTRNLYNSRKMAFQRDSDENEDDVEEKQEIETDSGESKRRKKSDFIDTELEDSQPVIKVPQETDQEENMVKGQNRRFELPDDKTRTNIKPVEVSINSLTYKITGLKNFQRLFQNARQNKDDLTLTVGKARNSVPRAYGPPVSSNGANKDWIWPIRRYRGSNRQPRNLT